MGWLRKPLKIAASKGDHVIPLYTPECREGYSCLSRKTNLCTSIRATQGQGLMPDGTSRFSIGKDKIFHYMGCSTFANFTVLPEIALAKVNPDAPFDKICYIGCGVTTGIGAVINTAKVEIGSTAIVLGLGGIGLNVLQGLRLAGAEMIIGVDINNDRKAWGEKFGMTHFVNPREVGDDIVPYLVNMTKRNGDTIGGADYTGNTKMMRQALESSHHPEGANFSVVAVAPTENVTVLENGDKLAVVDASALIQRHACKECGVHMHGPVEREHAFKGLSFIHPERFEEKGWAVPGFAAFVSSIIEAGVAPDQMSAVRARLKETGLEPYDCLAPGLMDYLATWTAKKNGVLHD